MTDQSLALRTVGFIGLGNMGRPMSRRLADAGYDVRGYDASPTALLAATDGTGVHPAGSPAAAAEGCDAVILMLPNSDVVEEVVLRAGVLEAVAPGGLLIDMSSSEPMRTRDLARTTAARGLELIDAPVSGGVSGAEAGSLTIMTGGEPAVLERAQQLLGQLGTRIQRAGGVGAGHAVKALNNLMSATHLLSACEAVLAGERFGIDPAIMLEIVNGSSGRSGSTENKLPNFVLPAKFNTGFALGLMLKDMRIALSLTHATGTSSALSESAVQLWDDAAKALGPGVDHTEIARWVERPASSRED